MAENIAFLRPAATETLPTATLTLPPKLGRDFSRLWLIIRKLPDWFCGHFANFSKHFSKRFHGGEDFLGVAGNRNLRPDLRDALVRADEEGGADDP